MTGDETPWAPPEAPPAGPLPGRSSAPAYTQPSPLRDGGAPEVEPIPRLAVFDRSLTVPDILDGAFAIIKARPRTMTAIAAMVVLPIGLAVALIDIGALGGDLVATLTDPDSFEQSTTDDPGFGFTIVSGLVTSAMVTLMAAPIARVVEAWYLGRDLSAFEAVRGLGFGWVSVVVAFIVVHVIEAFGTVLLVLPGVAAMALLLPVTPVVALERVGPFKAVRRSVQLARHRFWNVLWVALLSGLVAQTLALMLPLLPLSVIAVLGVGGEQYAVAAATIATSLLTMPFVAAAAVLTYFDLRDRTEGLDIRYAMGEHFGATS